MHLKTKLTRLLVAGLVGVPLVTCVTAGTANAATCKPPANATWKSNSLSVTHTIRDGGKNYVLSADPFDSRADGGFNDTLWAGPANSGTWGTCFRAENAYWPYPSTALNIPYGLDVNKTASLTGTYKVTVPPLSAWHGEASFDIWLNGHPGDNGGEWLPRGGAPTEFMLWVDTTPGEGTGDQSYGNVTVAGQTWQLTTNYASGGVRIIMVAHTSKASGTVNIGALIKWAETNQYTRQLVGSDPYVGQAEFGEEIASTGGVTQSFTNASSVNWK